MRKQANGNVIPSAPIVALTIAGILSGLALASTANAADVPRADLVNRKELRVCADPSDMPFSNQKGEGFENKIADIIADELKLPVKYTWFPKSMGFIRMTLGAKRCDLVVGWGQGDDVVLNTNAIYRSTSVLIYKKGTGLDGVDIGPRLLAATKPAERKLYWHFPHYNNQGGRPAGAVRDGNWKYITYYDTGETQLFDLQSDVEEQKNLAGEQADPDASRAGVDGKNLFAGGQAHAITPKSKQARRASASNTPSAQLAVRERGLSERLVKTMGTRAPSTSPADSAPAK